MVHSLRDSAQRAVPAVAEATGMAADPSLAETKVVDRLTWARSNVSGIQVAVEPVAHLLESKNSVLPAAVSAKATGVQLGAVLAFLSSKVLGQYETFVPVGQPRRLLLVAPNIVKAEQQLDVVPVDFRLWVAVHEETHRLQFTAVPWLAGYMESEVQALLAATDSSPLETIRRMVAKRSLMDAMTSPAQAAILDNLTAMMSLLEGHAEFVMDAVGPEVIPTVEVIRSRFDEKRGQHGSVDGVLRRLMGMDAKMKQYFDGGAFVHAVVDDVGMESFNRIWESPKTLPTKDEITNHRAWIKRVLD